MKKRMVYILSICLVLSLLLGVIGAGITAKAVKPPTASLVNAVGVVSGTKEVKGVLGEWEFSKEGVKTGSLEKNDLVLLDKSGNGNDLDLNSRRAEKELSFSQERMHDGTTGSIQFESAKRGWFGGGSDFRTVKDAPLNTETFDDGYTIEFVYMLPSDFTVEDSWMGLLGRQGSSESNKETRKTSTSIAISNCKEVQFYTANKADNHSMKSAAWSISMDKGGVWYHIAITSDGETIRTFVNGCEAFRDYVVKGDDAAQVQAQKMVGLLADPKKGQFVIGSFGNGIMNQYMRGNLQQVRIAGRALEKEEWLVQNPEKLIGDYGSNKDFTLTGLGNYNVVFVPDIQNASEFRPNVLTDGFDWMNKQKEKMNIGAVVGLGDLVNTADVDEQWTNAFAGMDKILSMDIPLINQPGNHDYPLKRSPEKLSYLENFGPKSAFGEVLAKRGVTFSPSGYSSWTTFNGGSYEYLILAVSMYHLDDEAEVAFVKDVLEKHKNVPTIVSSHDVQNADDAAPDKVKLSTRGAVLWGLVKDYNQVFLMYGGHSHGAGEEVLLNTAGNAVYSVLADYQFSYNGGNLWLKFAEFDEARNKIKISTFSPYASSLGNDKKTFFDVNYMTGPGNYTVIDFDFGRRFDGLAKTGDEQSKTNDIAKQVYALADGVASGNKAEIQEILRLASGDDKKLATGLAVYVPFLEQALETATKLERENSSERVKLDSKVADELFPVEQKLTDSMAKAYKAPTNWTLWGIVLGAIVLVVLVLIIVLAVVRKKKKKKA